MLHLVITITHLSSSSLTLQLEDITLTSLENLHLSEHLQPQVDPEVFKSLKELSSAHLDNPAQLQLPLGVGLSHNPPYRERDRRPNWGILQDNWSATKLVLFPFPPNNEWYVAGYGTRGQVDVTRAAAPLDRR
jgi:hypothetical protein